MNTLNKMAFATLLALSCLFVAACSNDRESAEKWPATYGKVETYHYAPSANASTYYTVSINGESQFVYPTPEPHLVLFGCEGTVMVEIRSLKEKINTVAVRPISKNHLYKHDREKVTLCMNPLDRIVVEINGDEEHPIFLFANPLEEEEKPDRNDPNVIYYEAGKIHNASTIAVQSGQTLYVEGGAIVDGSISIADATDVTVAGCGILNSTSNTWAFNCNKSNNITVRNITVQNANGWTTCMAECFDITAYNYKVVATKSSLTETGVENDGFNLLGSRNATIEHCFSYSWDDAFCVKAQKWNSSGEVSNISYYDCIGWNARGGNTFEIGYELNQPVSNISYKNIYSIHSAIVSNPARRSAISIHNGAGGTVSNISYENVYIEDAKENGIDIRILQHVYEIGVGVTWSPGHINGVSLRNVHILKPARVYNVVVVGYDASHPVRNLSFEGLYIDGVKVTSANAAKFVILNATPTFQ